jgi:hypothetical protein
MLAYIYTTNGISVLLNGVLTSLAKDDPRFEPVTTAFNAGETDESAIAALIATPQAQLEAAIDAVKLSDLISIAGGVVFYKQRPLDNSLTRRMLDHLQQGVSVAPLVPFLENLEQNPSRRVEQTLYEFLEHGKIPLTTDGHFLAYKAVRSDWYDIHSGTLNNAVGEIVEVERNQVDEDPDRTCSYGLHVCSFDYLPFFSHADGHVVIVKVNPKDVVAIPRDYNNTKMRVCRYEVVSEVEGYYAERENYLSRQVVFGDWDPEPEPEPEPESNWFDDDEVDNAIDAQLFGAPLVSQDYTVELFDQSDDLWNRSTHRTWDDAVAVAEDNLDDVTPRAIVWGRGRRLDMHKA